MNFSFTKSLKMKTKRIVQLAASLSLAVLAQGAHAVDGTINFVGKVAPVPCTIPGTSQNMTVLLGTIKTSDLNGAVGKLSPPTPFTIQLICDPSVAATKGATATFQGPLDRDNKNALQVGAGQVTGSYAEGVAVVLADSAGTRINMEKESAVYRLNGGDNQLSFKASYISTLASVKPGPANATAQFTINYK